MSPDSAERFRWVLLWFVVQLVALAVHAVAFAGLLAAMAALGAWQNITHSRAQSGAQSGAHSRAQSGAQNATHSRAQNGAPSRPQSRSSGTTTNSANHTIANRLISAPLAAILALSGLVDLRLTGLVITGAAIGSVLVCWQAKRATAPALTGAGELVMAWLIVGIPACAATALAAQTISGAVVLVCALFAYETGLCIWGGSAVDPLVDPVRLFVRLFRRDSTHRSTQHAAQPESRSETHPDNNPADDSHQLPESHQLGGVLAGLTAACTLVFATTAISLPPYAPSDALSLMIAMLVAVPLGQTISIRYRSMRHRLAHRTETGSAAANPAANPAALNQDWVLRRLDVLLISAPAWLWVLELIRF